jgi:hypothetical protein
VTKRSRLVNVVALMAEWWSGAERAASEAVHRLAAPTEEDITVLLALELRKVRAPSLVAAAGIEGDH